MSRIINKIIKVSEKIKEVLDFVEANPSSKYLISQDESFDEIIVKVQTCNRKKAIAVNDEDCILLKDNQFACISTMQVKTNGYNCLKNETFLSLEEDENNLLGIFYKFPQVIVFSSDFNNDFNVRVVNVFNVMSKKWRSGVSVANNHTIGTEIENSIKEYSQNVLKVIKEKDSKNSDEAEFFMGFDMEYDKYIG